MDDQAEVIAYLAEPATYAIEGKVERVDTHASCVFLAGDRAFKLKRAVRHPYLDYSTVALREAACRAEYEMNRRIAPALYLGVRSIGRRADGGLGFDGAGAALDWVLEMRRFDAADLFDRIAEDGRLHQPLLRALADMIAAFHAGAERVAASGGSAGIAAVIDGNAEAFRAAREVLDQGTCARLERAQRAALAECAALLDRRRAAGKVRRCHGDLHLSNICRLDGAPTLFDAPEFGAAIVEIDVLYDLAFLLMDLIHRKLAPAANFVLNRYLDLAREDDGMSALPLFLSLRAAIRAHVTAASAPRQRSDQQRRHKAGAARRYLGLAETLLQRAPPRLAAVGGFSGSGKTTVALALAPYLAPPPGARVLRSDVLRKALLDVAPETRLPAAAYSHAMNKQIYATLQQQAARLLAAGVSVILDATFIDPKDRAAAEQVAKNAGVPFAGLWLEARPQVMAGRIAARSSDASDATPAVLERQLESDPGAMAWTRIDTGRTLARVTAAARRAAGIPAR